MNEGLAVFLVAIFFLVLGILLGRQYSRLPIGASSPPPAQEDLATKATPTLAVESLPAIGDLFVFHHNGYLYFSRVAGILEKRGFTHLQYCVWREDDEETGRPYGTSELGLFLRTRKKVSSQEAAIRSFDEN